MEGRNNGELFSSTHAEMDALLKAKRAFGVAFEKHAKKMKLYVIRIKADGSFTNAKPCRYCQEHLFNAGLKSKNIFYTDENGKWKNL